jgi:hypothetical protein
VSLTRGIEYYSQQSVLKDRNDEPERGE